ncbi:MAG: Spy/CpxP family protein refolding chaperone [Candidatus Gastranaerophilales bacterium]|nr:Spy/CpxP family protein refolding chaperone [Candidatus Gastranaerophilales bacterium]
MKKSLIITTLAVLVLLNGYDICQAKTNAASNQEVTASNAIKEEVTTNDDTLNLKAEKSFEKNSKTHLNAEGKDKMPPPPEFEGGEPDGMLPPPDFNEGRANMPHPKFEGKNPPPHAMQGGHPSKEEMEKKKAEFEKRLKLTDKQKKQIEENKIKDREKIKPVFDEMKAKKQELDKLKADETVSPIDKLKKEEQLKREIGDLKHKIRAAHESNMKNFESILTKKQKKEFEKIKKEQKNDMEKRRKQFEKSKKHAGSQHHPGMQPPFPPMSPKEHE